MLSHSHTALVVCMKRSQWRCATWPSPERTAPLMVRKTRTHKVLFLRTVNLYVLQLLGWELLPHPGCDRSVWWKVTGGIWISLSHLIWAVVDEGDIFNSKAFPDFLDELRGRCKSNLWDVPRFLDRKKHGGQSPVILNSGILRSGMSLYERSE